MPSTPGTNNFPGSPNDVDSLLQVKNDAGTTLAAPLLSTDVTATVVSTSLFPTSGPLTIENEIVFYTGTTPTTFTGLLRGQESTGGGVDHAVGVAVLQNITARSHAVVVETLISHETKLGTGPDAPAANEFLKGTGAGASGWAALTSGEVTTALGFTPIHLKAEIITALGYTPIKFFNVADYSGANDAAIINAAITAASAAGGGIVYLEQRTYTPPDNTSIAMKANVILAGHGSGSVLDCSAWTTDSSKAITANGSADTAVAITVQADENALTLTVTSTAGWAVGDYLKVASTKVTDALGQHQGEFVRILSVDSATAVTLMDPLCDTYALADTPTAQRHTLLAGVGIRDFWIKGPAAVGVRMAGIQVFRAEGFTAQNIRTFNVNNASIQLNDTIGSVVHACHFRDELGTGVAYGVEIDYACQDVSVVACTMFRQRHGVTVGGGTGTGMPRRIVVTGCAISQSNEAGLDCHPVGEDIAFVGNIILGSDSAGIVFKGTTALIANNTIRNSYSHGIFIQPQTNYAFDITVSGNRIDTTNLSPGNGSGIRVTATTGYSLFKGITIVGNTINDCWRGIDITNAETFRISGLSIVGNTIRTCSFQDHVIHVQKAELVQLVANTLDVTVNSRSGIYFTDVIDSTVIGNSVRSAAAVTGTRAIDFAAAVGLSVVGNQVSGAAAVGIALDNSCADCSVVANNVKQATTTISPGTGTGHDFPANLGYAATAAYTPTNVATDRSFDASATTVAELANVLGTLIADLQGNSLLG